MDWFIKLIDRFWRTTGCDRIMRKRGFFGCLEKGGVFFQFFFLQRCNIEIIDPINCVKCNCVKCKVFTSLETVIPYKCFSTAQDHIFALMKKDTYPRFLASKDLKVFAQKIKYEKRKERKALEGKAVNKRLVGVIGPGNSSLSYSD